MCSVILKIKLSYLKARVVIFTTLVLIYLPTISQNLNDYYRFNIDDKGLATTGYTISLGNNYGIGIQVNSNQENIYKVFHFDSSMSLVDDYSKKINSDYYYIQFSPPMVDNLGRVCHSYSMENSSIGRNAKFTIFNPENGNIIDSVYNRTYRSGFSGLKQNPDSTFLLFGTSTEFDPNGDFYVVQVGKNGEFISDTTYGNTNLAERGYAITTTSDGGYAFTGSRRVTVSGQPYRSKIVVYKFDSLGALEWTNQYGGDLLNLPYQIKSAENGNILIVGVGSTVEITDDFFDNSPQIIMLSLNGNLIWDTLLTLPPDSTNTFYQEGETTNLFFDEDKGHLYVAGYYYSFLERENIPANPSFLAKYDTYGNEIWRRYLFNNTFSNSNSNTRFIIYSIEPTPNGGFLLGGTINGKAPDPVGQYGWIVKTDSLGCVVPGCHLVGVPNPQGQIENNLLVYPNPSNNIQNTWLSFNSPKTEAVTIEILNLNGQIVKAQNFGILPQGNHQIQMDIPLPSGIYFVKLQTPSFSETVKLVVE